MDDKDRGKIRNEKLASQLHDFSNLRYQNNITPTDLDGLIDFQNKAFVFIEDKFGTTEMPFGQKLALERLADCVEVSGKLSLIIVCRHDYDKDTIDLASCIVTKIYFKRKWNNIKSSVTVKSVIEQFLRKFDLTYLIKEVAVKLEKPSLNINNRNIIKTEEDYKSIKAQVDELTNKITKADMWESKYAFWQEQVQKQKTLANQMLNYEIEHDLLPI